MNDSELHAIVGWAVRHPTLQQLMVGNLNEEGCLWIEDVGIAAARRMRPSLSIEPSTLVVPGIGI